ncbi:unnamed protein product [Polarella glacialis]|uniref:Guanine nucleotide-binding protein subunit beta-like protein n=1 Tax=Polarella glacialis TaxID=89957 RepID=A0A813H3L0_POLGL|nr:unnamed protein product [Polarella glacialis]
MSQRPTSQELKKSPSVVGRTKTGSLDSPSRSPSVPGKQRRSSTGSSAGEFGRQTSRDSAVSHAETEVGREPCALSGQDDGLIRLIDLATGNELKTMHGHTDWIHAIDAHFPTNRAVSVGGDGLVFLWDLDAATGTQLMPLSGTSRCCMRVVVVDWTKGSSRAITGNDAGNLAIWDLEAMSCTRVLKCKLGLVLCLSVDWAKMRGLVGHGDQMLDLLSLKDGSRLKNFKFSHGMAMTINVSWPKARSVCGYGDGVLSVCDLRKGEQICSMRGHKSSITVMEAQWPSRVISGSADHTLKLWDLKKGDCLRTIGGHPDVIRTLSVDWSLGVGLSSSTAGEMLLWETSDNAEDAAQPVCDGVRAGGVVLLGIAEVPMMEALPEDEEAWDLG